MDWRCWHRRHYTTGEFPCRWVSLCWPSPGAIHPLCTPYSLHLADQRLWPSGILTSVEIPMCFSPHTHKRSDARSLCMQSAYRFKPKGNPAGILVYYYKSSSLIGKLILLKGLLKSYGNEASSAFKVSRTGLLLLSLLASLAGWELYLPVMGICFPVSLLYSSFLTSQSRKAADFINKAGI